MSEQQGPYEQITYVVDGHVATGRSTAPKPATATPAIWPTRSRPPSFSPATMSLNVEYIRPLLAGEAYTVTGTLLQGGRTRTLIQGTITDGVRQLCSQDSGSLTPNRLLLKAAAEAREGN
ncbi:PaaI family thioesterase [Streptomyces sp. LN590]|uniref:PaaI family thioesterase n=1 Tax=unclassified Streptomyces TaxID=2593676 RepID=UPI003718913D